MHFDARRWLQSESGGLMMPLTSTWTVLLRCARFWIQTVICKFNFKQLLRWCDRTVSKTNNWAYKSWALILALIFCYRYCIHGTGCTYEAVSIGTGAAPILPAFLLVDHLATGELPSIWCSTSATTWFVLGELKQDIEPFNHGNNCASDRDTDQVQNDGEGLTGILLRLLNDLRPTQRF